jgi:Enoyl-CoA hydratase/isomerase
MTSALFMLECGGGATGRRRGHPTGGPSLNAISRALAADLDVVISAVADDPAVRSIAVYGGERVFAPGADVSDVYRRRPDRDRSHGLALERAFDRLVRLPKVVPARTGRARPSSPASADSRQGLARHRNGLQHNTLRAQGSTNAAGESLHRRDSSSFEKLA